MVQNGVEVVQSDAKVVQIGAKCFYTALHHFGAKWCKKVQNGAKVMLKWCKTVQKWCNVVPNGAKVVLKW